MPREIGDPQSWIDQNPGWDYRFWTDEDLLVFMRAEFPHLMDIYLAYPNPVQRADLSRYCLLWHFGGVYADIDTACISPLEPLAGDARVVLCSEPLAHITSGHLRGLEAMWFNGTMASPARHPFWLSVIELCKVMAPHGHVDVLASTGPLVLSGAVAQYPDQGGLSLNSCHIFTPHARGGVLDGAPSSGPHGELRLSHHYWRGSWYEGESPRGWGRAWDGFWRAAKGRWRKARHDLTAGPSQTLAQASAGIDLALMAAPLPPRRPAPDVVVFVPVRDGARFLDRNLALIQQLDYPKQNICIVYGEGESGDGSAAAIDRIIAKHGTAFAGISRLEIRTGGRTIPRRRRWLPALQLERRAMIARARNAMIAQGLAAGDDWVLWIDVDVVDFPPETLGRLLAAETKIVVPHCVLESGGPSYDCNSFLEVGEPTPAEYYKHVRHGLFQPPADYWCRRHLDGLRYLERVPLHGVGGTMLLVDANVHRAGLVFPETPYRDLIETEAFGVLARDLGISPIGLPGLEIRHDRS
ncbi:glycosyltransferase [Hoeflea marina]|uniref:glycosyltransferase n=1 Tax=Hoeflea marina TaxID=274592 RepID=UPI00130502E1|nr:glycosyltransferase [Hoeflea marina]